jgi:hypothetical protein
MINFFILFLDLMDDNTEQTAENPETQTQRGDEEVQQLYEETLLDANEAIEFAPGM